MVVAQEQHAFKVFSCEVEPSEPFSSEGIHSMDKKPLHRCRTRETCIILQEKFNSGLCFVSGEVAGLDFFGLVAFLPSCSAFFTGSRAGLAPWLKGATLLCRDYYPSGRN